MKLLNKIVFVGFVFLSFRATAQSNPPFNLHDSISHILVPNVFTPNGDSVNDVFRPILDEITGLNYTIYNRWGNLIYESNGRLRAFWDGRTNTGEPCTDGLYFCVLTATGIDGKSYKEKTAIQLYTSGLYNN